MIPELIIALSAGALMFGTGLYGALSQTNLVMIIMGVELILAAGVHHEHHHENRHNAHLGGHHHDLQNTQKLGLHDQKHQTHRRLREEQRQCRTDHRTGAEDDDAEPHGGTAEKHEENQLRGHIGTTRAMTPTTKIFASASGIPSFQLSSR